MAIGITYGVNGACAPTQINVATPGSQFYPGAVLTNSGNAAVFYYDNDGIGGHLRARLVGPNGAGFGAPRSRSRRAPGPAVATSATASPRWRS